MPAPVAIPTLVPDVVARATVNDVAGPGMNTKPRIIDAQVSKTAGSIMPFPSNGHGPASILGLR
ncbi:hypothetical protein [Roseisalinus antarcticus]|uniref:hypothetical protein n=1 Tax=Roseisalinus antarcticus TaxID=254357 RepID=UPI001356296B|nr:hypothetical protein [Roseisalinus antarcticus]